MNLSNVLTLKALAQYALAFKESFSIISAPHDESHLWALDTINENLDDVIALVHWDLRASRENVLFRNAQLEKIFKEIDEPDNSLGDPFEVMKSNRPLIKFLLLFFLQDFSYLAKELKAPKHGLLDLMNHIYEKEV